MHIAVVGGGLLGTTTALLAADRGWSVDLIEKEPGLWTQTSTVNEGKVHLGPIFALGTPATHDVMLRGALAFGRVLERAVGAGIDWGSMSTLPFDYLVMPDSLATPDELALIYSRMNELVPDGATYLGRPLDRLVDPAPGVDERTGLPIFHTDEIAVDPVRLGELLVGAVESNPAITLRLGTEARSLDTVDGRAGVHLSDGSVLEYDLAVNAAWDQQLALLPSAAGLTRNYRLKTAIRIPVRDEHRPVTLVQGPYGDVVGHADYTYASWYPEGRLSNEFALVPSAETYALKERIADPDFASALVARQLDALRSVGVLPEGATSGELFGGLIVGHGPTDIDAIDSALHSRSEFGTTVIGRVIVPSSFKFASAPLAAEEAVQTALEVTG
ncbi:FAD-dependent oxidoreductase [Salinibacterium soli]|uniref:FAD-dependent oxidoreductase n=1 Tax=Antiquaquibacter soli TaxID=3064523 RepID=A0ABT9BNQ7_9MICO|nr:FAD-dependent oxidoreductase [Protaetiibacter sp. WY-16]MDO7882599.1 FAD-dependent oxidoreductase [Protaetiibacter sp. WY-16]